MTSKRAHRAEATRFGRRLAQAGFLLLFLYPLAISLYQRLTFNTTPAFTSWLLPWDPGLLLGQTLSRDLAAIVLGAPLLLLALSLVFGRSFCGWVCPLGTLLDFLRPLAFWQRKTARPRATGLFPPGQNSRLRYLLLAAAAGASLFSLKVLGILDPLVIANRAWVTLTSNFISAGQRGANAALGLVSLVFLVILVLDGWQPRFWCRNLCPMGALLSLTARFSWLKRRVDPARCTGCRQCVRACEMNAISSDGQLTDYAHCTVCLDCFPTCPQGGVRFSFQLDEQQTPKSLLARSSQSASPQEPLPRADRRAFLGLLGAGALGAAVTPVLELLPARPALRPPGALPEREFLRACILCQECIRVCPTGGLRPALFESGFLGAGTPVLVPRLGGCALNPSCPDLCAAVCPVGAILPVTKTEMKIGVARVDRSACLAWDQGAKCLVCVEACLNSAAIPFNGRVTVDPFHCTGCGRCESGCPVPGSAIRVEPIDRSIG